MKMRLRFALSIAVLLALAANQPSLAKGAHPQHGGRGSATNNGASGKGASGANPPAAKARVPIDAKEATVAPPVLPPHRPMPQPNRNANQNPRIVTPGNAARSQARGAITPTSRNAIGQPIVQSKALAVTQPHPAPAVQAPGAVPPQIFRGEPSTTAPTVSSNLGQPQAAAHVTGLGTRSSVNGAAVIRPSTTAAGIGGPVRPANGINGTVVQSKH
jgi:hypothetical protein